MFVPHCCSIIEHLTSGQTMYIQNKGFGHGNVNDYLPRQSCCSIIEHLTSGQTMYIQNKGFGYGNVNDYPPCQSCFFLFIYLFIYSAIYLHTYLIIYYQYKYLSIPFLCGNKRKLRPTDHPSTFVKLIDSHIAWLDLRWFVFLRPFCKYYYLTVIGNFFL